MKSAYPKPLHNGGLLIRNVIGLLKSHAMTLPLKQKVVLAVSGGADSTALLVCLARYGRRVVPIENLSVVYIDHGWNAALSKKQSQFVRALCKEFSLKFKQIKANASIPKGTSWEQWGRKERQKVFRSYKDKALIMTAHHGDDLAETLLWRLLTGNYQTHGAGIYVQDQNCVRPFLSSKKSLMIKFLKEEKRSWVEDLSNFEGRFLRSKMRQNLMPALIEIFPKAVDHLIALALENQNTRASDLSQPPQALLELGLFRPKKAHYDTIRNVAYSKHANLEVHLPDGWKLVKKMNKSGNKKVQWILEK